MTKHETKGKMLFDQLGALTSERVNRSSTRIDTLGTAAILRIINAEDRKIADAVAKEIPSIARAVDLVVRALRRGGRLIYVGAGTSGRLGILDATECPPTFGTDPSMVEGVIAGGTKAVIRSQEGAEDDPRAGRRDMRKRRVGRTDVVCGIAASMRTPYVVAAMQEAKHRGASTVFVTTNPKSLLSTPALAGLQRCLDVAICPVVGPEVIMGSTRMKSGTAQKMVLNMITTAAMIRLGKVFGNMMVDLKLNSRKLEERAKRVIMAATGDDYESASGALAAAGGHVKTAIVMRLADLDASEARRRLRRARGFVARALKPKSKGAR